MTNESTARSRRSIRLKKYDYSLSGSYFITICVQNKQYLFGEITDKKMKLNKIGEMIDDQWNLLAKKFNHVELDEYVIMPNHFHAILFIDDSHACQKLGQLVGIFKSITTHEFAKGIENNYWSSENKKFWQRNYYEHVIRNDRTLSAIRNYIVNNPMNWHLDRMNLALKFRRGQYM